VSSILFINGPAEGHVNPTLAVVKALIARGHRVVYVCTESYRGKIEATGAEFWPIDDYIARQRTGNPFLLLLRSASTAIPHVVDRAKHEAFDYIVHDSFFGWGAWIAKLLKLPSISSYTSFTMTSRRPERIGEFPGLRVLKLVAGALFKPVIHREAQAVAKRFNMPVPTLKEILFNHGDMNIMYFTKEFHPNYELLDDTFVYVGPTIENRPVQSDLDIDAFKGDRKLVYISLGTVLNRKLAFFRACLAACADQDYQVILSTGDRIDPCRLGPIPSNILVRPYVPQLEILKRADLFVTHGGMNSTCEGLYHQVPLIVIPQGFDQPMIAACVKRLGAGIVMSRHSLTAGKLRRGIHEVLHNSDYRANASHVGASFAAAGGTSAAVDAIEWFDRELQASRRA
jgi:MGT family glycosyltransferase